MKWGMIINIWVGTNEYTKGISSHLSITGSRHNQELWILQTVDLAYVVVQMPVWPRCQSHIRQGGYINDVL